MDIKWIIVDDNQDRITALAEAIKATKCGSISHILWMAKQSQSGSFEFGRLLKESNGINAQSLRPLAQIDHSGAIMLLDLKWTLNGLDRDYTANLDEIHIKTWVEKSADRLVFSHSTGRNAYEDVERPINQKNVKACANNSEVSHLT